MKLIVIATSAVLATTEVQELADASLFVERCVAALSRDGRTPDSTKGACECVARRTEDRPELRVEFLDNLKALRANKEVKSSQALRQVRAACIPMPIWGWNGDATRAIE